MYGYSDFKSVDYNGLAPYLIEAVKELDTLITDNSQSISAVETKLTGDFNVEGALNLGMSASDLSVAHSIEATGSFQTVDGASDLHTITGGVNGDSLLLMFFSETDWTIHDMDILSDAAANTQLVSDGHTMDSTGD